MSENYTCMKCYKQVEGEGTHICRPFEGESMPLPSQQTSDEPNTQERIAVALESIAASLDGLIEYLATKGE